MSHAVSIVFENSDCILIRKVCMLSVSLVATCSTLSFRLTPIGLLDSSKKLGRDKHSSLFRDEEKRFYNLETRRSQRSSLGKLMRGCTIKLYGFV